MVSGCMAVNTNRHTINLLKKQIYHRILYRSCRARSASILNRDNRHENKRRCDASTVEGNVHPKQSKDLPDTERKTIAPTMEKSGPKKHQ